MIARYEGVDPSQDQNLQHQAYRASFEVARADAAAEARQAGRRAGDRAGEKGRPARRSQRRPATRRRPPSKASWAAIAEQQAIEAAQARAAARRGSAATPGDATDRAHADGDGAAGLRGVGAGACTRAGGRHPRPRPRHASTRPATPAERRLAQLTYLSFSSVSVKRTPAP